MSLWPDKDGSLSKTTHREQDGMALTLRLSQMWCCVSQIFHVEAGAKIIESAAVTVSRISLLFPTTVHLHPCKQCFHSC